MSMLRDLCLHADVYRARSAFHNILSRGNYHGMVDSKGLNEPRSIQRHLLWHLDRDGIRVRDLAGSLHLYRFSSASREPSRVCSNLRKCPKDPLSLPHSPTQSQPIYQHTLPFFPITSCLKTKQDTIRNLRFTILEKYRSVSLEHKNRSPTPLLSHTQETATQSESSKQQAALTVTSTGTTVSTLSLNTTLHLCRPGAHISLPSPSNPTI